MCGLAGVVYIHEEKPLAPTWHAHLTAMAHRLRHRGPNDQGLWFQPEHGVGLAHRRLSIYDLSERGRQPMLDDEDNALVFNGAIYNFQQLRTHHIHEPLKSETDTEVLLKRLAKKGEQALDELDGMFAFGFYSSKKRELLLAVDPAGKKPLYTYWDGKIFAFASEIKALKALEALRFDLDREHLKSALIFGYVPSPYTPYRFVRKLPAGYFQKVSLQTGPSPIVQYWDVPLGQIDTTLTLPDAEEALRQLLKEAVSKRLTADVPIGCFLSGGLDSSAICWEAAQLLPKHSLKTYSAGFKGDAHGAFYDESPYARKVAKLVGSEHTELQINAASQSGADIMNWFDEPFGDSSAIPTYLLCEKTAQQVKVVLSGDGGDELFGGYLRFRAALLSEKYKSLSQWALAPLLALNPKPRSRLGKLKRYRLALSHPLIKRLAIWNSFFEESEMDRFLGETTDHLFATLKIWEQRTQGISLGEKILYFNFKTYLFDDLLPKVDRMSMVHGLEVRSPFLDRKMIEFAFRLPTAFKFDAFRTKIILKNAYRQRLGSDITDRAKHGFAFPLETFFQNSKPSHDRLQTVFPKANLSGEVLGPLNRFSKQFILFSIDQSLSPSKGL